MLKKRRGSSLLLTMGILIIVSVFAVSIVSIALYNQSNSQLNETKTQSKLSLQTGLQLIHQTLADAYATTDAENLYPATIEASNFTSANSRYYWAFDGNGTATGYSDAISIKIGGKSYTPANASGKWQNITDTEGRIISRIAALIVDESGKIDPSAAISEDVTEGEEAGQRLGLDPSELNLKNLVSTAIATGFQHEKNNGSLPANHSWYSYNDILTLNDSAGSSSSTIFSGTVFPFSEDLEAFHDGSIDRHRFDLKNTDWDNFANSLETTVFATESSEFWNEQDVAPNSGGINWFSKMADTDFQNEILANLVDFCDSDSIATTDNAESPTYMGLEKVPYINEIQLMAEIVESNGSYTLNVHLTPELINMYDTDMGQGAILTVRATLSATGFEEEEEQVLTFTLEENIEKKSYFSLVSQALTLDINDNDTVDSLNITIHSIKLTDKDENLWDFAFTEDFKTEIGANIEYGVIGYMTADVDDPRANLKNENWQWTALWDTSPNGTLDAKNTNCVINPGEDGDVETEATEPWEISTAYIPDRAPRFFWELGALFRAKKWQSLNLSVHSDEAAMGDYSLGDANLLDQIKLTEDTVTRGTVNINSPYTNVLYTLLMDIVVEAPLSDPNNSETVIGTNEAKLALEDESTAENGWLYLNGSGSTGAPFKSRAELANIPNLVNGSLFTQDSDAAKEELICKIANICTVRNNFFKIIITSQSVRDLTNTGTVGIFDSTDKILAETTMLATVHRDAFTNKLKVLSFEYLTE